MKDAPDGVTEELDRLLASGLDRSTRLGQDHRDLWDALSLASGGGKRFRPGLAVATHDALGGSSSDSVDRVGAALELLHTAFVVHDDVIDGDDVRRGRPNVSGTFAAAARDAGADQPAARHYGEAAGILAGDLALVSAVRLVARCQAPAALVDELLDLLEDTVHATASGELADVRLGLHLSGHPVTLDEALRVAEQKTAVYSFQLPLQAGAILAGAPADVTAALARLGRLVGIGFQLLDDLLGVFGNETRTGKSALTDLREGKHTALLAHARTTAAWPDLQGLVGDPDLDHHDAGRARALLEDCGARDAVQEVADRHLEEALAAAARKPIPAALARVLTDLVRDIRDTAVLALDDPRTVRSVDASTSSPAVAPPDAAAEPAQFADASRAGAR
ncbi:geranylgeranyl pyrophosphate synthase [Citricoccus zhacaiensis]|uniref:Geranylgeranyl pyrophosphate synthase n=1 Tax=Citricoccus zhacaiensis TaxID=489142 RepID=A0ABQ2LQT7_9MICC|nr:polyprenyl synthetase family protein [Citricoccus zhacaiensis]GGO42049.1 geranylgeranyl pyrophosphate synthase [Citricoccus zhacaiensis]